MTAVAVPRTGGRARGGEDSAGDLALSSLSPPRLLRDRASSRQGDLSESSTLEDPSSVAPGKEISRAILKVRLM